VNSEQGLSPGSAELEGVGTEGTTNRGCHILKTVSPPQGWYVRSLSFVMYAAVKNLVSVGHCHILVDFIL
jgi:hypothetical protein